MGMPQNKNDLPYVLTHKRMLTCTLIALAIFQGACAPIFFMETPPSDGVLVGWTTGAGIVGMLIGISITRVRDWRCALPEWLRAIFFRKLGHPWKETRRVDWYVEQFCPRCERYRHGKMTAYDAVEKWKAGKIPA
jgi:hypothetical protein